MDPQIVPAAHLLVVGGILNIAFSFLLGWVLSAKRMKGPMEPHRWLLVAHEVALQEGIMLLGIAFALTFAKMSGGLATTAAWLLIAASFFQDFSGVLNWLKRTNDQFVDKSPGWIFATINAILNTVGIAMVVVGVIAGCCA